MYGDGGDIGPSTIDISESLLPIAPSNIEVGRGIGGSDLADFGFTAQPGRFMPSPSDLYGPGSGIFGAGFDPNVDIFDPSSYISDFMESPYAGMIKPSKRKNKDSQEATGSEQTFEGTTEPETGIFGGTIGPKFKKFFSKLASIHPATRNAKFAYDFIRGLRNAKDPKSFVGGMMKRLALGKVLGGKGLGLSGMQRQGLGSLVNMARGKQTMRQGLGSLATSAAFRSAAPSLMKSAYKSGGMNGVYAAMAALQMAQRAAQGRIAKGPGGGG